MFEKTRLACEAGVSIKPGAQAPGQPNKIKPRARETGDSAVARFAGSRPFFFYSFLGLAPQALFCRPLRGLGAPHPLALLAFAGSGRNIL